MLLCAALRPKELPLSSQRHAHGNILQAPPLCPPHLFQQVVAEEEAEGAAQVGWVHGRLPAVLLCMLSCVGEGTLARAYVEQMPAASWCVCAATQVHIGCNSVCPRRAHLWTTWRPRLRPHWWVKCVRRDRCAMQTNTLRLADALNWLLSRWKRETRGWHNRRQAAGWVHMP